MSETMGRLLAAGQRAEVFEWGTRVVKLCRSAGSKRRVIIPHRFDEANISVNSDCQAASRMAPGGLRPINWTEMGT